MVINPLSLEIILSCLFWVEFKANNSKAFTMNESYRWICLESLCWILQNFIVNGSVTGVRDLNCLIHRLIWPTAWESGIFLGVKLDHRDEWLGSWRERVTNKSDVHADWWIDIFVHGILEL